MGKFHVTQITRTSPASKLLNMAVIRQFRDTLPPKAVQMPRFEVFAKTTAIGYSELESGDLPMSLAAGRFIPLPAYEAVQPMVVAAQNGPQDHLALAVRTEDGSTIPAQAGVQINDFSAELGSEGIEVEVLGIDYPLYEELFPARHAEYVAGLGKKE
jgi:hypothetical protein